MKTLEAFQRGDGAHRGLSDWYKEKEEALAAALAAHAPFSTGWYGSKHEIASARIRAEDGIKIKIDASVSDDFDTDGRGYSSTEVWTLEAVAEAVDAAWDSADKDREDNELYVGFSVRRNGAWEETYLVDVAGFDYPPGDNYYWWGWQHDETDEVGIPHPDIPLPAVAAFENWARRWVFGKADTPSLRIGAWEIKPWRDNLPAYEDPNDYRGMGWVGADGRP